MHLSGGPIAFKCVRKRMGFIRWASVTDGLMNLPVGYFWGINWDSRWAPGQASRWFAWEPLVMPGDLARYPADMDTDDYFDSEDDETISVDGMREVDTTATAKARAQPVPAASGLHLRQRLGGSESRRRHATQQLQSPHLKEKGMMGLYESGQLGSRVIFSW